MNPSNIVEFPQMGIGPFEIKNTAVSNLFGFDINIYWSVIIFLIGLVITIVFSFLFLKKLGMKKEHAFDVTVWSVIVGLIGARFFSFILESSSFSNFFDIFNFAKGGVPIFGGLIFGFLFACIYCRIKKYGLLLICDVLSFSLFLGQAFGNWGLLFITELNPGSLAPNSVFGMMVNGQGPSHPIFLYNIFIAILGFIVLFLYNKFLKKNNGETFFIYLFYYGICATIVEMFKNNTFMIFNINITQVFMILFAVIGLAGFILLKSGVLQAWKEEKEEKIKEKEKAYTDTFKHKVDTLPTSYVADKETIEESIRQYELGKAAENRALEEGERADDSAEVENIEIKVNDDNDYANQDDKNIGDEEEN